MLQSSLHTYVDARFTEAFGKPHNTMGHDDHWRLESASAGPINILLNGTQEIPALWVFDARDADVFKSTITWESQVAGLIIQIQERVERAANLPSTV